MTHDDRDRTDLDRAARDVEQSLRRAEQDAQQAREVATKALSLASMLRRLREENGFESMFREAFGGRSG